MDAKTQSLMVLALASASDVGSAADAIERSTSGSAAMADKLPTNGHDRPAWEALGVKFGDSIDDLFTAATLPTGWSKQPTDHAMHTSIVDAAGNVRGSYFYKAAFWDQDAILYAPKVRYSACMEYADRDNRDWYEANETVTFAVLDACDGDAPMFTESRSVSAPAPDQDGRPHDVHRAWHDEHDARKAEALGACQARLAERFPRHADPAAYWPT